MQDTWYVLEDGSSADPNEVALDENGVLRHKDGGAVAIGPHGNYRSRGVDPDIERAKIDAAKAGKKPASASAAKLETKELVSEKPKGGYKNREIKAS